MDDSGRRRTRNRGVAAIDDAEIKGYLNTKKDMIYKNIIWEILNKRYLQGESQKQKQKQPGKEKNEKSEGAKRKKRINDEIEEEKKKQRLSSKVNFDVLEKLEEDEGEEEGGNKNEKVKTIVESEENYGEEEDDYGDAIGGYHGNEEDEVEGYSFNEDWDYEDY